MKASRITAVGLVIAAGLWIASGHFMPHESAESRASVRPAETAEKLFRVGVIETNVAQHSRKLLLSGRTEADRKVMAVARTGGVPSFPTFIPDRHSGRLVPLWPASTRPGRRG